MFKFFNEIDEEATISGVKLLLSNYKMFNNLGKRSGVEEMQLQSTEISDMPSGGNVSNTAEDKLIRAISPNVMAKWHAVHCKHAIEAIEDDVERSILHMKFISNQTATTIEIELSLSKAAFYRKLDEACLTFAEIYGLEEMIIGKGDKAYSSLDDIFERNNR